VKIRVLYEDNMPQDKIWDISDKRRYVFGRDADCDFKLSDVQTSRHHFSIDTSADKPVIVDLGSCNGTILNGRKIKKSNLSTDDIIIVGECRLRFETGSSVDGIGSVDIVDDRPDDISTSFKHRYAPEKWQDASGGVGESIVEMSRKLDRVCYLSGWIFAGHSTEDIFKIVLDEALELTGGERASALLVDKETGRTKPVMVRMPGLEICSAFPVSKTIVRETLDTGESVISDCLDDDARFKGSDSVSEQSLVSVMCVPLMTLKEEIIGVLYIDTADPAKKFTNKDLSLFAALGYQTAVAVERAGLVSDMERLFFGAILSLSASIEAKDKYTKGHSERVTCYSLIIADEMGLVERDRTVVELAGIMHDVGKVGVPEVILSCPGKLTEEDFTLVRQHPEKGAEIISKMPDIAGVAPIHEVARATKYHHEKFDGTGYPEGLSGDGIPLVSRILAVADTFDAITSDRSYRKGRTAASAMKILSACAGTQVDPDVLAAFERAYDKGLLEVAAKVRSHLKFDASELLAPIGCN